MSKVRFQISMSLDGYVAGPNMTEVRAVDAPGVTHIKHRVRPA